MSDTDQDPIKISQEAAELGTQTNQQTQGDDAEARPIEDGDTPDPAGDDSDQTSDPLLLAHMEPEARSEQPTAKPVAPVATKPTTQQKTPTEAVKPGKDEPPKAAADTAKPAATDTQDEEMAEAIKDLPPEDWEKLSHKGKSQFLAHRKILKAQDASIRTERKAREEAESRYNDVDKFVRDQGLGNEEYVNTVAVSGMVKRGDPRAIAILEQTLQGLRQATGQAAPAAPVAPPVLDNDLAAILREAEEFGIDTTKVRARFNAPAATPPEAPAATEQRHPAKQQIPVANDGGDNENQRIISYLQKRGITDPVARVKELIAANPELLNKPVGERYEAIIEAHSTGGIKQQPQQRRPVTAPMSGRGGPVRVANAPSLDPLQHAIRR